MNKWTTSRTDLESYTENPETGETEFVVYIYCDPAQRIAVFGADARERADLIAQAVNEKMERDSK